MAKELEVYGPFEIDYEKGGSCKRIQKSHANTFWTKSSTSKLKTKQGCYIFAMKAGTGFTPWYVGKAGKKFSQEIFTDHKRDHYNDALFKKSFGNPVMFLVAPPGNINKVRTADLNHLEKELIQFALNKNSDLCNTQNTKNLPSWSIKGVIRSGAGKPRKNALSFKKMMGI